MSQKSIAVLTSGGDAPGMNAAVRAVVRTGINRGMRVYGIHRGYNGLLKEDIEEMDLRSVSDIIGNGGTKLYTARCKEVELEENQLKAAKYCQETGINGIVVVGGDGSFRGARALANAAKKLGSDIQCIGVPGTIDNDIACSEYTIGFDTAMNTALEMVDRIRDTAQSHDRCSIVEVMGRRCVTSPCRPASLPARPRSWYPRSSTTLNATLSRVSSIPRKPASSTSSSLWQKASAA